MVRANLQLVSIQRLGDVFAVAMCSTLYSRCWIILEDSFVEDFPLLPGLIGIAICIRVSRQKREGPAGNGRALSWSDLNLD
jgi:hypothetical protein